MNSEEKILEAIAQLRSDMDARLDKVDARLDKVDARLDKVDARLDKVDARLDKVDARLDKVDARLDKVESRLDKVESRLDKVDARLDKVESRLDKVETEVSGVRILVDVDIEKKLNLLAEGQQVLLETLTPKAKTEELEDKYAVLHAAVAQHSWEIAELKKAQ